MSEQAIPFLKKMHFFCIFQFVYVNLHKKLMEYPRRYQILRRNMGITRLRVRDLHNKQNKNAHDDDIMLSSFVIAKTITDFITLYINIIALL